MLIPVFTDRKETIYINPNKVISVRVRDNSTSKPYAKNSFEANYAAAEMSSSGLKYHISLEGFGFDIESAEWERLRSLLVSE